MKTKTLQRRYEEEDYYELILCAVLDELEGGDIALDFEDSPSAATTIRIIAKIASDALLGLRATRELLDKMNKALDNSQENDEQEEVIE